MRPTIVDQIRQRRAFAKQVGQRLPRKVRRVPRQLFPSGVMVDYVRALRREVQAIRDDVDAEILPLIAGAKLEHDAERGIRRDKASDDLRGAFARVRGNFTKRLAKLQSSITTTAKRIADFNGEQISNQVRQTLGVDVWAAEPWLHDELSIWGRTNTALVEKLGETTFSKVDDIVTRGVQRGTPTDGITTQIREALGVSDGKARLIARDQVGKLNGRLTELRQRKIGVGSYRWRGMMDAKERPEHIAREGQVFSWDDPPPDGHPGEPVQCRCTAEPVLDEFEGLFDD